MKRTVVTMIILSLSFSLLAIEMKSNGKVRRMRAPMMIMPMDILDEVGVSEDIKSEIKSSSESLKEEMKAGFKTVKLLHEEVKDELMKNSPDRTLIDQKVAEIAELKKEGMLKIEKFKIDTFLKLNLEQRKKALDLLKEKRENMMKKMMRNGMPPMPPEEGPETE